MSIHTDDRNSRVERERAIGTEGDALAMLDETAPLDETACWLGAALTAVIASAPSGSRVQLDSKLSRCGAGEAGVGIACLAVQRALMLMLMLMLVLGSQALHVSTAAAADKVFTVGNYPVQAKADNAVKAKQAAVRDGQTAALRSLLKRLVPVTSYARLKQLKLEDAGGLVDSVRVRSERNSRTVYVAELDISFEPDSVRGLLGRAGLDYVETPSARVTVVPIYVEPQMIQGDVPAQMRRSAGARLWQDVWKGLDLENGLVPVNLKPLLSRIHPDTVDMAFDGTGGADRILAGEYGTQHVIIARLQPDLSTNRLTLELAGRDAVAPLLFKRVFRFDPDDLAYAVELAAVVAHGILEGRWKTVAPRQATQSDAVGSVPAQTAPSQSGYGPQMPGLSSAGVVPVRVEFISLSQWNQIRQTLEATDGVRRVDVNGLSPRAAEVAVDFNGSGRDLARALSDRGLRMVQTSGGVWLLR